MTLTKDELKQYIKECELDQELEKILLSMVDEAQEVNKPLVDTIADILDMQADFFEKTADLLEEESNEYEALAGELNLLSAEEQKRRMQALKENQEKLLGELTDKAKEMQIGVEQNVTDAQQVQQAKSILQEAAQEQQQTGPVVVTENPVSIPVSPFTQPSVPFVPASAVANPAIPVDSLPPAPVARSTYPMTPPAMAPDTTPVMDMEPGTSPLPTETPQHQLDHPEHLIPTLPNELYPVAPFTMPITPGK